MQRVSSATSNYLTRWLVTTGAQPPLLLVTPTTGAGLEEVLLDIKLRAVCTAKAVTPCRVCHSCRLVVQAAHPDIHDFAPTAATWRIKDVRELRSRLARTSVSPLRIIVLRHAEQFVGPAAAALLKMLEEPSIATRYLLVTAWPRRLLATIRSRCHVIRVQDVPVTTGEAATDFTMKELFKKISRRGDVMLDTEDITNIAHMLTARLRAQGPSSELRRAFMRLRDYYLIASRHGNAKLAAEVVVLSVPESDGIS